MLSKNCFKNKMIICYSFNYHDHLNAPRNVMFAQIARCLFSLCTNLWWRNILIPLVFLFLVMRSRTFWTRTLIIVSLISLLIRGCMYWLSGKKSYLYGFFLDVLVKSWNKAFSADVPEFGSWSRHNQSETNQ